MQYTQLYYFQLIDVTTILKQQYYIIMTKILAKSCHPHPAKKFTKLFENLFQPQYGPMPIGLLDGLKIIKVSIIYH